tara:strand:- start:3014 stop:3184 length:171 start_codon:yes stop_codon:yes gene_type:complete
MEGEISHENSENINTAASLFYQIAVLKDHHASAPSEATFRKPPLEGCGRQFAAPSF